jgi:hypothetical protein
MRSRHRGERRGGERRRHRAPALPAGEISRAAAATARRHPWRILAVSVTVCLVTAAAELAAGHLIDRTNLPLLVAGSVCSSIISVLGWVFLSGFLCQVVSGEDPDGARISAVVRTLPWGPLVRADLLVALLTVIGLIALVIPGLIVMNLLAVTGPVIEIERRKARAALRRSAHLVRPHFWKVALLGTVPVILASGVESALPSPEGLPRLVVALAVRGVVEGVVEAVIGLLLVQLCFRLIVADRAQRAARPVRPPA